MTILVRNGKKLRGRTAKGPTPNKTGWNVSHPDGNAYFAEHANAQAFHDAVTRAIKVGVQPPAIPPRSERLRRQDNSQPTGVTPNDRGWLVTRGRGKVYFSDEGKALAYRALVVATMDAGKPLPAIPPRSERCVSTNCKVQPGRPVGRKYKKGHQIAP